MAVPSQTHLSWTQTLIAGWLLLTFLFAALNPGATQGYGLAARVLHWAVHVGAPLAI